MLDNKCTALKGISTEAPSSAFDDEHDRTQTKGGFAVPADKQPISLRALDLVIASIGLVLSMPFVLLAALLIWLEDRDNPLYIAERIGLGGKPFQFIKLRSISRKQGVRPDEIIPACDQRVSWLGHFIRASKIDELPQFLHVLAGQMSLVGPRPNVPAIVESFTAEEMRILSVKPGITDLASVVFVNLGAMLKGSNDPKGDYEKLVRPWKSRLALLYVDNQSVAMNLRILWLTALAFLHRDQALRGVAKIVERHRAHPKLIRIVRREQELAPFPPPGADWQADSATDQRRQHPRERAVLRA